MAHPTARVWIRAVIVSLILSALLTIGGSIAFGGVTRYLPPDESAKVEKMTYGEALTYIEQRGQSISGWETFRNSLRTWWFWRFLLQVWALLFLFGFLCSATVIWWSGIRPVPSNPTVETDARKSGARGSP
jgi:hypothetical protein